METGTALYVGYKVVAVVTLQSAVGNLVADCLREIVVIQQVITCVIRRINIYHLHRAKIVLAPKFLHFEIVILYVESLCRYQSLRSLHGKGAACR